MGQKSIGWSHIRVQGGLYLVILLVGLGILFRSVKLDGKVFWVDEVATAMRVAGYTKAEVIAALADGRVLSVDDLQRYQHLSRERTWSDTLQALVRSPEHAPLYFLLLRGWQQMWGSSVRVMRSFSLLWSVLALPGLYWLSWEVFGSLAVSSVAVGLMAVSPFFVAYAQEARPYSFWVVSLLVSGAMLVRSLRWNGVSSWVGYGVATGIGLYTSLLSGLVLVGQGVYVGGVVGWRWRPEVRNYVMAVGVVLLGLVPWGLVVVGQWEVLHQNTAWMRSPLHPIAMLAIWFYSVAVLFFDVPIVVSPLWVGVVEVLVAVAVVSLMGYAIYFVCTHTSRRAWLFVLTLVATTPTALILIDLIWQRQSSTAARYLIPCHIGLVLAIAYLLTLKVQFALKARKQQTWKLIAAILVSISLMSCFFQFKQPPKYQKSRNLHNQPIAALINQANAPILLAEPEQTIDLISLSYQLNSEVRLQIAPPTQLMSILNSCHNKFIFTPSTLLHHKIQQETPFTLEQVYQPPRLIPNEIAISLWSVENPSHSCSGEYRSN